MSTCRSCRAPILWVTMVNTGASMPVNPEPIPEGNVEVFPVDGNPRRGRVLSGDLFEAESDPGSTRHFAHFVSCPNAASHRRKR